jgi:hypothetical protein
MPLSIADRLHRLPHGAQLEVANECGVHKSTVSQIAHAEYQGGKTEASQQLVQRVQLALAAKYDPPLPVWEVFAEWDGERPPDAVQEPSTMAEAS